MCASKPKAPPPSPPPAAPVVQAAPATVQGKAPTESQDEGLRKRKREGRNTLRIDANITGDGGAGGNGLNIPR